ncbi:substrate-binding domain-containing protein [Paenibacillus sp. Marseille-Q4541]|uniref:substrate-binding domain-containing protein n=1 Tax=Paenibacillus sp. Marseille-Q4541 TaxID=2831522 RepID=UPI001BACF239|nr:substrate-binding domain-containing protein [Paenibacillus sp. Marseille-Q4541]
MRKKVTMQQIADTAGVSKFAVSRALTGKSGVSEQTRDKIIRTAGQLGYFKNGTGGAARAVVSDEEKDREMNPDWQRQTGTILVLFPNIRHQNMDSLYWGPVFEGISARLNEKGLDILTLTEPSSDKVFSLLNPEAIQGIITVGAVSPSLLLEFQRLQIPVVMVDHSDSAFHCDTVFSDNISLMREMMNQLIAIGYRKFQFAGNIYDAPSFLERWTAFRMMLDEHNIPLEQNTKLFHEDIVGLKEAVSEIPKSQLPEVFVCVNDSTARFVLEQLTNQNVSVPDDCTVTGFDNVMVDLPILATVDVNKSLLGRRAVDQLLWRVEHPSSPAERLLIHAEMIFRDTYMTPKRG